MKRRVTSLPGFLICAALTLSGCGVMNPLSSMTYYVQPAKGTAQATSVQVFYATNRAPATDPAHDPWFDYKFAPISYGTVTVTIPKGHIVGGAQLPSFTGSKVTRTDTSISQQPSALDKDKFFSDLNTAAGDKGNNILLIIHGFNTTYADAVCAAGQLNFDLSSTAVPVVLSWPSRGGISQYPYLGSYPEDENSEYDSINTVRDFLGDLHSRCTGAHIRLIAHSMGARLLVDALMRTPAPTSAWFTNLIFAAPDVDAVGFTAALSSGTTLPTFADNICVYVCEQDLALLASRDLHSGLPSQAANALSRAGEGGKLLQPVTNPAIDTIDASQLVATPPYHSYIFDNRNVIADVFVSLYLGKPKAKDRQFITPGVGNANVYTLLP